MALDAEFRTTDVSRFPWRGESIDTIETPLNISAQDVYFRYSKNPSATTRLESLLSILESDSNTGLD